MKKTIILFGTAAALLTAACNKSEILAPTDRRHIYIAYPDSENPIFNFSFLSTPDETARIAVPITFAGRPLTGDLDFAIEVSPETTLAEGSEYQLPELVFHQEKGFRDTIYVAIHKTERMENDTYTLKFNLVSNANFLATMTGALEAEIRVTAQVAQPSWWTQEVTDYYLGTYSDLKFELFTLHGYIGDYGALDDNEKRYYALKFKYWLQENPQTEADGTAMNVPIQG